MKSYTVWDLEDDATLYAMWEPIVYTITYITNGGTNPSANPKTYTIETPTFTLKKPTKTGYNGEWSVPTIYKGTTGNLRITASWQLIEYYVHICNAEYSSWTPVAVDDSIYSFKLRYGESRTVTAASHNGYVFKCWVYYPTSISSPNLNASELPVLSYEKTVTIKNLSTIDGVDYDVVACYDVSESCIATGTLITLADGRQVPVESLTGNEMLLVWNMYTGTFDTAPILFIDSDPLSLYKVIQLTFSDGTMVDVISEHGFFDVDMNKYVYLDEYAAKYIGHSFLKQGANGMVQVTLEGVTITQANTMAYSPVTYGHLCYYVNGMLSMPGGIDGLFNIFEVDRNIMMYDAEAMAADIEEYGLYTYEELSALVPVTEEMFEAVNAQYLKVAVGKGMITVEQIGRLIERYADMFA